MRASDRALVRSAGVHGCTALRIGRHPASELGDRRPATGGITAPVV
ncbi:hypothetical protein ACFXD5_16150 [Streptomyces sp. NPDC059385]